MVNYLHGWEPESQFTSGFMLDFHQNGLQDITSPIGMLMDRVYRFTSCLWFALDTVDKKATCKLLALLHDQMIYNQGVIEYRLRTLKGLRLHRWMSGARAMYLWKSWTDQRGRDPSSPCIIPGAILQNRSVCEPTRPKCCHNFAAYPGEETRWLDCVEPASSEKSESILS